MFQAAARRPTGVVKESADLAAALAQVRAAAGVVESPQIFHLLVLWASMGIEPGQVRGPEDLAPQASHGGRSADGTEA